MLKVALPFLICNSAIPSVNNFITHIPVTTYPLKNYVSFYYGIITLGNTERKEGKIFMEEIMESILLSVKKMLGVSEEYTFFDHDIIIF